MMEQIVITIDTEANVTVKVEGHAGTGCQALTEQIENALGETTKDIKTHEYHEAARHSLHAGHNA